MLPLEVTSRASTSSLFVSARPTSEPSKYICQAPLVTFPREVGINASTSSSLAESPVTDVLPVVEISTLPSESSETESRLSAEVVSPTSLPSKYMLKVPAVVVPRDVASKRTISCGATAMPFTVTEALNAIRMLSGSRMEKPTRSTAASPTSEPSKNRLQVSPLRFKISSSAETTPATVWLSSSDTKRDWSGA